MSFYKDTARKNAHAYPRNFREITLEDEILENSVPGDLDTGRRYPYTAEQRSRFPIIFVNGRPTFKKMPDAPLEIPVRSTIPHQIIEVPFEIIFQDINYILRSRFGRDFEWTPPRIYYMTNIRKVRFMNELRIAAGLMRGIVKGPLTASVTEGKDEVCFAVSGNKDLLIRFFRGHVPRKKHFARSVRGFCLPKADKTCAKRSALLLLEKACLFQQLKGAKFQKLFRDFIMTIPRQIIRMITNLTTTNPSGEEISSPLPFFVTHMPPPQTPNYICTIENRTSANGRGRAGLF